MRYSGALWGRKKEKGRERPLAVVELHESCWSGRSCLRKWLLPQHSDDALYKLSTPGSPGKHCVWGKEPFMFPAKQPGL